MDGGGPVGVDIEALLGHADFVRGLARSLCTEADADDVAQQAWLAAMQRPPRDARNPRGWLVAVVRRLAAQLRRGEGRRARRERAVAADEAVASTAELLERESVRRQVVEAVLALDEPYRSVVVWRYFEGLEPVAIAERSGTPAATVRTRLHRALAQLRRMLDGQHGGQRARWATALLPLVGMLGRDARAGVGLLAAVAAAVLVVASAVAWSLRSGTVGRPEPNGRVVALPLVGARAVPASGDATAEPPTPAVGSGDAAPASSATGPTTPSFPRQGVVVHAETGKPVAGAVVTVYGLLDEGLLWPFDLPVGDETDEQGRFPMERTWIGKRVCAVLHEVGCSDWVPITENLTSLTLRLVPGNAVEGTVINVATGEPVGGAYLSLYLYDAGRGESGPSTVTDASGRYRFAGIPPGITALPDVGATAELGGGDAGTADRVGQDGGPTIDDLVRGGRAVRFAGTGNTARIPLRLEPKPGVHVTYRLLVPPGTPVPTSVRVGYQRAELGGEPYGWGISIAELDPDRPEVIWFMGIGRHRLHIFGAGVEALVPWRSVESSGPPERVDLPLSRLPRITAQLVDESGRPIRRVGVTLTMLAAWDHDAGRGSAHAQQWGTATTDSDGRADISDALPPIRLDPDGEEAAPSHARGYLLCIVPVGEGIFRLSHQPETLDAGCRLSDGFLRTRIRAVGDAAVVLPVLARAGLPLPLRVVTAEGRPRPGVSVRGLPIECFDDDGIATSDGEGRVNLRYRGGPAPLPSDASLAEQRRRALLPRIEIDDERWVGVVPGIGHPDPLLWQRDLAPEVDAATGHVIQRLTAEPARVVRLRLTGRTGEPLAATTVDVNWAGADGTVQIARDTDGRGELSLRLPVRPGPLTVHVARWDGTRGWLRLDLASGATEADGMCYSIPVVIPVEHLGALARESPGGIYRVQYFDGEGRPIPHWFSGGGWSTLDKRPDAKIPCISFDAPGETRRTVVSYRGFERTIDLPDGLPVEVPVWRVGE